jgi:hypothetical protein
VRAAREALIAGSELPTLLVWSEGGRGIPDSFTPEDQPEAVATAIRSFVAERVQ